MSKLVERFDSILDNACTNWDEIDWDKHNEECAEEAKKLAIKFHNYIQENYVSVWNTNKYVYKNYVYIGITDNNVEQTIEELFSEFIDKYYE